MQGEQAQLHTSNDKACYHTLYSHTYGSHFQLLLDWGAGSSKKEMVTIDLQVNNVILTNYSWYMRGFTRATGSVSIGSTGRSSVDMGSLMRTGGRDVTTWGCKQHIHKIQLLLWGTFISIEQIKGNISLLLVKQHTVPHNQVNPGLQV